MAVSNHRFPRYERLLDLYPSAYRQKYGPQMAQTLADMLDDTSSPGQRQLIWARVAADVPLSLARTHIQYLGGIMHNETPSYIKQTGIVTAMMVLPFFAALASNGIDKVLNNRTLYQSWLWHMPILGLWVVWLPATALALSLMSYFAYTFAPGQRLRSTRLQRALDITHLWPIMAPVVVAFAILCLFLFHDSVHCWVQNPVHFVTRWHQTWQCTRQGFVGG